MALTHIFACVLLIVMSSLRVRSWRRWEEGAADGGGGAAAKGLSPAPPPAPSDASAAAAAAAAALEAGPSASAPAVEMGAAAAALGLGLSRKRVSFPEEIEGGRGAAAAAVAAGKKTAPATATTTTTTTAVTPSQRRRSVLLQRADKLDGFWPKLGEVGICILRQLLVLFPVTKREYLEMREAWMAAHGLDGSGAAAVAAAGGKGKEEGGCCCCCRESKDDGDGGDGCGGGGDGKGEKCCSCGCAASGSLPPICFADYVMKSFDDDVAGIVGLVKREFFLFLVRVRRRRKNLNLDLLSTSISTRFFFKRKKKTSLSFPGHPDVDPPHRFSAPLGPHRLVHLGLPRRGRCAAARAGRQARVDRPIHLSRAGDSVTRDLRSPRVRSRGRLLSSRSSSSSSSAAAAAARPGPERVFLPEAVADAAADQAAAVLRVAGERGRSFDWSSRAWAALWPMPVPMPRWQKEAPRGERGSFVFPPLRAAATDFFGFLVSNLERRKTLTFSSRTRAHPKTYEQMINQIGLEQRSLLLAELRPALLFLLAERLERERERERERESKTRNSLFLHPHPLFFSLSLSLSLILPPPRPPVDSGQLVGSSRRLRPHVRRPRGQCHAGLLHLRPPRSRPQAAPASLGRASRALPARGRAAEEGDRREGQAGEGQGVFQEPREAAAAEDGVEEAAEAERPERAVDVFFKYFFLL